jgi:endonuclease/exonuclease/phosphatase family metal-dependent hydrolase
MKKNYLSCASFSPPIGGAVVFRLLFVSVFLVLSGCSLFELKTEEKEKAQDRTITLMTWNVNNLFDGKDNGYEYNEFLESAGWSTEKYLGRINTISAAIDTIEPQPDVIILQEIESLKILEDLTNSMSGNYSLSHFANNPGAALGVGILSRFPISEARVHSITVDSQTTPRPVLEARVNIDKDAFVIFACHWKSKVGGDDVTEDVRRASARVILRRIRELWKSEPSLGVIVAGDLNENHDEFYRRGANVICALLPDDPYCAELTGCLEADSKKIPALQKDFIVISRNMPPSPVNFPEGSVVLFSPWMGYLENGSYYYKNNWETIDHFLVSAHFFSNTGWNYEKTAVVKDSHFTNSSGIPVSYNVRTGSGISDHLPLLFILRKTADE